MSVRNDILNKIKPLAKVEHPGVFQGASTEFDFRASLEVVGARVVTQKELEDLFPGQRRYDKTLDGLSLEEVEVLEIDGEFGVAENGAIWLKEEALPHRVAPFICQHLVIHVTKIVPHMHAAYEILIGLVGSEMCITDRVKRGGLATSGGAIYLSAFGDTCKKNSSPHACRL